jgi:hypothetical protein
MKILSIFIFSFSLLMSALQPSVAGLPAFDSEGKALPSLSGGGKYCNLLDPAISL